MGHSHINYARPPQPKLVPPPIWLQEYWGWTKPTHTRSTGTSSEGRWDGALLGVFSLLALPFMLFNRALNNMDRAAAARRFQRREARIRERQFSRGHDYRYPSPITGASAYPE
jgi:hypothetical protein